MPLWDIRSSGSILPVYGTLVMVQDGKLLLCKRAEARPGEERQVLYNQPPCLHRCPKECVRRDDRFPLPFTLPSSPLPQFLPHEHPHFSHPSRTASLRRPTRSISAGTSPTALRTPVLMIAIAATYELYVYATFPLLAIVAVAIVSAWHRDSLAGPQRRFPSCHVLQIDMWYRR